jgi:hypothetical protein
MAIDINDYFLTLEVYKNSELVATQVAPKQLFWKLISSWGFVQTSSDHYSMKVKDSNGNLLKAI